MNKKKFSVLFPIGSHLCREPMPPMSEMKHDMEVLKKHGFNLIKLQEHWQLDEAVEGKYDFSRYEELITYADKLDLGIYLGLTCEQAPAWLWRKHPACRMVGRNGLPLAYEAVNTMPGDGKPGPCFDHPGAVADHLRFIERLVKALAKYENIVVWNTWQEIGGMGGVDGNSLCFCANTLASFRQWLQKRYGDLDVINRSWNTKYGDWQDVAPSRTVNYRGPNAVDMAWETFIVNDHIASILIKRYEVIRKTDPLKRPIFAHKGAPAFTSGQDWTYAGCQDFLGSSCYPAWNSGDPWDDWRCNASKTTDPHEALLAETWRGVALYFDFVRSFNKPDKPVWAAEFQGGPVCTGFQKGRVPSAEDMRRWMLTAIGSGVNAISFWVTRAEIVAAESNGFSLLDSEGDSTQRFEEASRIGRALNRHADLFASSVRRVSKVAVLINEGNNVFSSLMVQGGENLYLSIRGWHRILWDAGIAVDFVDVSELDQNYIADYKVMILPFPVSLSEDVAGKLRKYVEKGGNLICEAAPGRIDENGFCNRGEISPVMRELFGVRQETFTMVREPDGGNRWSPRERTWGEYLDAAMLDGTNELHGYKLRANVYIETFTPIDCKPILKFGDAVAAVVRTVKKGQAWLLGTYVGHNGTAYRDPSTRSCIMALLSRNGVLPEHNGRLLQRTRILQDKEAWIFTNPTEKTVTESVHVANWPHVEDLFGEPLTRIGESVELTVKSLDVRVLVVSR